MWTRGPEGRNPSKNRTQAAPLQDGPCPIKREKAKTTDALLETPKTYRVLTRVLTPAEKTEDLWHVLVVEDNPDHALMLQRTLQESGRFRVTMTRNAGDAEKSLDEDEFDAIITDHRLPDSDGVRFVETARKAGFGGIILLVTAQASDEVAASGIKAGADDYVFKARGYANRVLEELLAHLEAPA